MITWKVEPNCPAPSLCRHISGRDLTPTSGHLPRTRTGSMERVPKHSTDPTTDGGGSRHRRPSAPPPPWSSPPDHQPFPLRCQIIYLPAIVRLRRKGGGERPGAVRGRGLYRRPPCDPDVFHLFSGSIFSSFLFFFPSGRDCGFWIILYCATSLSCSSVGAGPH